MSRITDHQTKVARLLSLTIAIILVALPFSALLTTWLASSLGHRYLLVLWKEIVIVACLPFAAYLLLTNDRLKKLVFKDRVFGLMLAYLALHVLRGLSALTGHSVTTSALNYGLIINLRFFGLFAICYVVASQDDLLRRYWYKLLVYPSIGAVVFGLLQKLVLPRDFLRHFGYGQGSLPVYQTVDQKLDYTRLQSTLRGANPLGAYLIMPITAYRYVNSRLKQAMLLIAGLAVLFFSYSRSAWLGLAVSLAVMTWAGVRSKYVRRWFLIAAVAGTVLLGLVLVVGRHNRLLENTAFHTDQTSHSAKSSNASRLSAIKSGMHDVVHEPLGRGPGTAGPASVINHHPRIAEDYYLQIGQEVGVFGLIIFLAINIFVGLGLWQRRDQKLALLLFCTLAGISLVNLISHAWTDETLSLIWWGLAGLALAPHQTKRMV